MHLCSYIIHIIIPSSSKHYFLGGGVKSSDIVKSIADLDVEIRSSIEAAAAVLMGMVFDLESTSVVLSSHQTLCLTALNF